MTRGDVQRWLDRYISAWAADDAEAIGDLFTTDARYRFHPSDAGFVGRDAIVRSWLQPDGDASTRDEPGTWDAHYEPFVVGANRAVAVGWNRYYTDTSKTSVRFMFDNAYLLEFDEDGRCSSFTEFYVERPKDRVKGGST